MFDRPIRRRHHRRHHHHHHHDHCHHHNNMFLETNYIHLKMALEVSYYSSSTNPSKVVFEGLVKIYLTYIIEGAFDFSFSLTRCIYSRNIVLIKL